MLMKDNLLDGDGTQMTIDYQMLMTKQTKYTA